MYIYTNIYNTECKKLKLPEAKISQVCIFHLSQYFFVFPLTHKDKWATSLIAMQVPFVRHFIPAADSGWSS